MDSMSCKKIDIVYTSVSGNTGKLASMIHEHTWNLGRELPSETKMWHIDDFPFHRLAMVDAVMIGTYTWGSGEIPKEMVPLYQEVERIQRKSLVTGVFGTGDSFYPDFCGAVNEFRDMLYAQTTLAATLKVELLPQVKDYMRCEKFVRTIDWKLTENLILS